MAKQDKERIAGKLDRVARLVRTDLAMRLLDHGFYAGQEKIMLALEEMESMTPGQLAARFGVRPATVTKMVNRLMAQGYLEKTDSEKDGRISHVSLTITGRLAVKSVEKAVRRNEKKLLNGLSKKERKIFRKMLDRLEAGLAEAKADEP